MAFVVEDGTGLSTANAYASVAEVTTYLTDRDGQAWSSASTAVKQAAIVEATTYIDSHYTFANGRRLKSDQALMWPRAGAFDFEGYSLTGIPKILKDACAELANFALTDDLNGSQDRQTVSETVGPISVTYRAGANDRKSYPAVDAMLARWGIISGSAAIRAVRA